MAPLFRDLSQSKNLSRAEPGTSVPNGNKWQWHGKNQIIYF
jgi:hypothetical protein